MEIKVCPSCGGAIHPQKGGRFFCEPCDCIFRITREGPRVEKVGPLDALAGRVDRIEEQIGQTGAAQDPKPAADSPPGQPAADPPEDPDGGEIDDDAADDVNELWGD